jgi:hypothetical protein
MSKPGRPQKNRIKRHATYSPEFLAETDPQVLKGESFGETIERLLAEKNATILKLQSQLAEFQRHNMQGEGQASGTDEAIRQVVLSLQVWLANPADTVARDGVEAALKRCFVEKG